MNMSFREFVNPGAFQDTSKVGIDNHFFGIGKSDLPTPTLDLPTKTIASKVRRINYTENPISINLQDGTTWNVTKKQWDYLVAIGKTPKVNSSIQIEMYLDGTIKSLDVFGGDPGRSQPAPLAQQSGKPGVKNVNPKRGPF
jgi:hypothetical protein